MSFKVGMLALGLLLSGCEAAPNSAAADTAAADAELTLAKFNELKTGMSYAEAVGVLGFDGTEQSSSELGGTKTVMYAWANRDGMANMNAMFQDGKLVTKAQFGLR